MARALDGTRHHPKQYATAEDAKADWPTADIDAIRKGLELSRIVEPLRLVHGLSPREQMAAMAMQGLLSNSGVIVNDDPDDGIMELVAYAACKAADMLIAELDRKVPKTKGNDGEES